MRSRAAIVSVVVMGVLFAWWYVRQVRAGEPETVRAAPAPRQDVELTVYAQDFGMVREVRPVTLAQGSNRLRVVDVSRQMDPHSILLQWQGREGAQIVAHAYDLGVTSGEGLLKRYLGREVEIVRYGENGREAERQRGTLMVQAIDEVVVQTDGRFYLQPEGTIVVPAAAEVVTIPQLTVQAESPSAQSAQLALAYLTRGLSWSADYVATLAPQGNTLSLECWAAVTNRTGVDYPFAKVTLIAGSPNRAVTSGVGGREGEEYTYRAVGMARRRASLAAASAPFASPEVAGEFHAYPIAKPTTVVQEQMSRLLMLAHATVPVKKEYSVTPPTLSPWSDPDWGTTGQPRREGASVAIRFRNGTREGLGLPLPRGSVRVYEPDAKGMLRYAGAAAIADTPKNQRVRLTLARAFDLSAETRVTDTRRLNRRTLRKQVEVLLQNEKRSQVEVRVVQTFYGRWKIARASHPHAKRDAASAEWRVRVPASGKLPLTYTVDLTE